MSRVEEMEEIEGVGMSFASIECLLNTQNVNYYYYF